MRGFAIQSENYQLPRLNANTKPHKLFPQYEFNNLNLYKTNVGYNNACHYVKIEREKEKKILQIFYFYKITDYGKKAKSLTSLRQ